MVSLFSFQFNSIDLLFNTRTHNTYHISLFSLHVTFSSTFKFDHAKNHHLSSVARILKLVEGFWPPCHKLRFDTHYDSKNRYCSSSPSPMFFASDFYKVFLPSSCVPSSVTSHHLARVLDFASSFERSN